MGVKAHMDPCFTLISGWLIEVYETKHMLAVMVTVLSFTSIFKWVL
jgi:hypothetical protein